MSDEVARNTVSSIDAARVAEVKGRYSDGSAITTSREACEGRTAGIQEVRFWIYGNYGSWGPWHPAKPAGQGLSGSLIAGLNALAAWIRSYERAFEPIGKDNGPGPTGLVGFVPNQITLSARELAERPYRQRPYRVPDDVVAVVTKIDHVREEVTISSVPKLELALVKRLERHMQLFRQLGTRAFGATEGDLRSCGL